MTERYGTGEIVQVLSGACLINSAWHLHCYMTRDRLPLGPGFYLVLWPAGSSSSAYNGDARYFGPFPTKPLAELLQASAVAFGIIEPDSSMAAQAVGNCYNHECWQPVGGVPRFGTHGPAFGH